MCAFPLQRRDFSKQRSSSLQTPVIVRVTPTTTPEDLEEMVFSRVARTSFDTLAPDSPVVLCFDDLGCLPVRAPRLLVRFSVDSSFPSYLF